MKGKCSIAIALAFIVGVGTGALAFPTTETIVETETVTETKFELQTQTEYVERVEYEYVERIQYIDRVEYVDKISYVEIEISPFQSLGEFTVTAYCPCEKCCGKWAENRPKDTNGNEIVYTASGAVARPNHTIAVDPSIIPYGTELLIDGILYTAEDSGSGVKGKWIDIYFTNHAEAAQFSMQTLEVFLKTGKE